jgi:hypothetical protein
MTAQSEYELFFSFIVNFVGLSLQLFTILPCWASLSDSVFLYAICKHKRFSFFFVIYLGRYTFVLSVYDEFSMVVSHSFLCKCLYINALGCSLFSRISDV